MPLKAIALSVMPTGKVDRIAVGGQIRTAGDDVITVDIAGQVGEIAVAGGISATGRNADAIHVHGDVAGLDAIASHARYGQAIVRTG